MAVKEGLRPVLAQEGLVDSLGRSRGPERQIAGRESLRQADEIGTDRGVFRGEHATRASKAGENLVGDQESSVAVAQLAGTGKKFRRPYDHAAGGLQHRLHHDTGDRVAASL